MRLTDAQTGATLITNDLTSLMFPGVGVCGFEWSPDGQYLAFLAACAELAPSIPRDIFLWRPDTNTITQVTQFAHPFYGQYPILAVDFSLFWYDADTLLIGVIDNKLWTDINQTIAYHPSTQTTTVLSSLMTREWVRNPVSGQLAYRAFTTDAFTPVNPVIHLSTYADEVLTVNATLPNGCDLDWSPDGATLAYTVRGVTCTEPVTALAFYDVASGTTQQVAVTDYREVLPVGWVRRPTGEVNGQVSVQGISSPAGLPVRVRMVGEGGPEPGTAGLRLAGLRAGSTAIELSATSAAPAVGEAFTVTMTVRSGAQRIDAAGALLAFDPGALQVEAVTLGGSLPVELLSTFDNAAGQVSVAAGTFSRAPRGTFTLAEVTLRALHPGVTTLRLEAGTADETNAYWRGQSVWDGGTGDLVISIGEEG